MENDQDWKDEEEEASEPWHNDPDAWKKNPPADSGDSQPVFEPQRAAVWSEEQWEQFIDQIDKSGRHIIAYYEKFWNFAERDRMVEEAMALYCVREAFNEMYPGHEKEYYLRFYLRPELTEMGLQAMDYHDFFHAKERTLNENYVYRLCRDFYRQCKYWFMGLPPEKRIERIKDGLIHHAQLACTKFAGAHIIGYQPLTLGGNIALLKKALQQIHITGYELRFALDAGTMNAANYDYLVKVHHEARNQLAFRIVELRQILNRFLT